MSALYGRRWRTALVFAALASVSGVLLVGVSAWFLGAVALAGLGPAAYAFGFHHPAAIVRLLALTRTTAKYGERAAGHGAALRDQTEHRETLFARMAAARRTRAAGWQLARGDRLQAFLGDVERVDFARLRAVLPVLSAAGSALLVAVLTLVCLPAALPALLLQVGLLTAGAAMLARRAEDRAGAVLADQARTCAVLGQQLSGLVSLEGGGERGARIAECLALGRSAERGAAIARARLGAADTLLAILGPACAGTVLLVAAARGLSGENALPALLAAFAWLALGETFGPIARAAFARRAARRAASALSCWTERDGPASAPRPGEIGIDRVALRDAAGRRLGGTASITARPGEPAALLGPSGCGKTTLLKRIAGWLPWTDGAHPLGSGAQARASCHLSLHDAAVLDASVRDNLFSEAPDDALQAALDAVELGRRIDEAGGLDARLTQDTLSLGEARRLALARAWLTPAPVVLLDEPGEHLDIDQAERILARLSARLRGKTLVFVTHEARLAALASRTSAIG